MSKAVWLQREFGIFEMDGKWNDLPGVYIFAGVNGNNQWQALYVGQASSFAQRMSGHERWVEARRAGATRVHALVCKQQSERDSLEQALIRTYSPRLNSHYA
jgi:excinuclease UvrABC nuclease subunit